MKTTKIIVLALALLSSVKMFGQEYSGEMRTLFKNKPDVRVTHGGYGAFTVGYSQIDSKDALMLGARFAWIANHKFALGFAGYGFMNNIEKSEFYDKKDYYLAGGYGGLLFEPIIMPHSPVHLSFPVILGAGGISVVESNGWKDFHGRYNYYTDTDVFFVVEPGVDLEFNVVKFFRIGVGASYRFTNGVSLRYKHLDANFDEIVTEIDKDALDSFSFNLSFKFGWF
ncbi:MAG: hypothetical protein RBR84_12450 [Bacteroidales bacterium]|jgi:hypothetical protein|nr:hypothetical protein [Bacteroidales bacterium]MDD4087599.1 hypothetical protein [Bacteroidales bacterium]MDY0086722.1 hypothetical protein [Bacteroidales bacterium]HPG33945.1 hypothetical protein [Lentimicrobium sp.]